MKKLIILLILILTTLSSFSQIIRGDELYFNGSRLKGNGSSWVLYPTGVLSQACAFTENGFPYNTTLTGLESLKFSNTLYSSDWLFGFVNDTSAFSDDTTYAMSVNAIRFYVNSKLTGLLPAGPSGRLQYNNLGVFGAAPITTNGSNLDVNSDFIYLHSTGYDNGLFMIPHLLTLSTSDQALSNPTKLTLSDSTLIAMTMINSQFRVDTNGSYFLYKGDTLFKINQAGIAIKEGVSIDSTITIDDAMENATPDSINVGGKTIRYNASEGVHEFITGKDGVVWQGALEDLVQIYNNTGSTLENFRPFRFTGSVGDTMATAAYVGASTPFAKTVRGLITADIANGDWGYGAVRGKVRGGDASGLSSVGPVYLSNDSNLTSTKQAYPSDVIVMGGVISNDNDSGIVYVDVNLGFQRIIQSKSYNFTSQGIGAGTYYRSGFYEESTTDANLTQASTTQTFGTANAAKSAHPFIVCGGAGSVNTGVVGLRVTGTSIDDEGVRTPGDADTILTDITSVATDEYYEAKKFSGTVTYELITISGTPTTYSLDFNYGYAKYEDVGNRDFYIFGVECVGQAAATDATFNIELLHHKATGWTYAATGFVPGDGSIADFSTDLGTESSLINGEDFAWKRTNLNTFIEGSGSEGILMRITTNTNNSVQSMDMHITGAID